MKLSLTLPSTMFTLIGLLFLSQSAAAAMPAEERETMRLYFDEDELVETATRSPKSISQVAENVTIITGEEIEAMNAHNVAEVLQRVAGTFVIFGGRDFAGAAAVNMHGAQYEQIAVLVDGVRWRYASDISETYQIPVRIIKRIEVIKGPASSTWGSSLGGVINIITRDAGSTTTPTGVVSTALGEYGSHDLRADMAGRFGGLGYYLYAGSRESDGIKDNRYFRNKSLYAKLDGKPSDDIRLTFSLGSTGPENKYLHDPVWDSEDLVDERDFFVTGNLDMRLTDSLSFNLLLRSYENDYTNFGRLLSTGAEWYRLRYDTRNTGASSRLVYTHGAHSLVLGAEFDRIEEDDKDALTPYTAATIYDEFWGIYLNDTIRWGDLTVTPGVRSDHFSLQDSLLSPSLGLTYRLTSETLLRAMAARGFRKPSVGNNLGDVAIWGTSNPLLEAEEVDSLQVGIETVALSHWRVKATAFRHVARKVWMFDASWLQVNGGKERKKGLELAIESMPFHNLSLVSNYAYVHTEPGNSGANDSIYQANLGLRYDDQQTLQAELFGRYIWYGTLFSSDAWNGHEDDFLWDLNIRKTVLTRSAYAVALFSTVHNLFNSSQYYWSGADNAPRWAEIGLRVTY